MFAGIGFGAEQIGLAALRFPRTAALLLLGLLVAIGLSVPRLSFDDDIHRVFLSDSPLSQAQRAYDAEQSRPLSTVLIHVAAPQPFTAADMAALRDLSLDLEFLDGVTTVASPFVLRLPPDADAPSGRPLFGPTMTDAYPDAIRAFNALQTGLPSFMGDDLTTLLLSVSVDTDQRPIAQATPDIMATLARGLPSALRANITGEDVISAEIVSGLKNDLIALNLWGAAIVMLAAFALLRDLRMALLAVIPAVFGAAGVLALSVWLGYPVTVLSNVIPILLLVLGVADGVHLAGHVKAGGSAHGAVTSVGPACALTALTTAIAFASITLTGNAQLFEFAILGALGTLFSFVIVIVAFALLARFMSLSTRAIPTISRAAARRLAQAGTARPTAVIVTCVALLALSGFGFSQTKAWFPLYQNLPDTSATLATNDAIAAEFGGVFQMIVETEASWEQTRALVSRLETEVRTGAVLSEVNLARWLGRTETRPMQADLDLLPELVVGQVRPESGASRIFISVPEPMRSDDTLAAFDRLHDLAMATGQTRVIGLPTIMRHEAVTLIDQLSRGLVVAAIGATLLVALAFRSARFIPLLIVPNILPLMLTGASLHLWAQGELSPTAVLALTIAFGIAIDDTVHFLNRHTQARAGGASARDAVAMAARSAGQMIVLTTLLLTAGLSVTLFSDFTPIRLFGGMMIVTLWAALLVDLLLLPALLTWKEARHVDA